MASDICVLLGKRSGATHGQGWRQIDLAQHSGVHEVHVSDLERGTREIGLRTLKKIADALDTTASDLLNGL